MRYSIIRFSHRLIGAEMPQLKTLINPRNKVFQEAAAATAALVAELNTTLAKVMAGRDEKLCQQHLQKGKLLPRERINRLLDPEEELLELSPLAGHHLSPEPIPSAGIITGLGRIAGQECIIITDVPTVNSAIYHPLTIKKLLRAQEIALANHLPCLYLMDSDAGNISPQDEALLNSDCFGQILYNQVQLAERNIPQIALVFGVAWGINAYIPALADECIMVKNQAAVFSANLAEVKALTNEITTPEELGGAELHCRHSGLADYYAADEQQALAIARSVITNYHRAKLYIPAAHTPCEPKYDSIELYGIVSPNLKKAFDVKEVIARLVDNSEFDEYQALYANTLVCGMAYLQGYPIGIIANNGMLSSEAAQKGIKFIAICGKRGIPLLFLQNITGFTIGSKYEMAGITKYTADMIAAVAATTVPKFTIIIGGTSGPGNFMMGGRAFKPNFIWLWPSAYSPAADNDQQTPLAYPYYSSARLWDDGVIDPIETRKVLARCLRVARTI